MTAGAALLTRPLSDARETAAILASRGIETVVAPLIDIVPNDAVPPLDGVQALLITSANGVRTFAGQTARRDLPIFAVGDASARAARAAGFTAVASAAGDVGDLANLVRHRLSPGGGALLHPAGTAVAGDLAALLSEDGFDVRRYIAYTARAADRLPESARLAIARRQIAAVLLYSPRTATIFRELVGAAGLGEYCGDFNALCLSKAVAGALSPLQFQDVRVAPRPEQAALLALL